MIRAILGWIHRITAPPAPPVEVRVGDVWEEDDGNPWHPGWIVLELRDGWVRYRHPNLDTDERRLDEFRRGCKLRARASEEGDV